MLLTAFVPKMALAHCPLCTVGAGALAVFAASIGVSSVVVGIMIGAFALALGLWLSNILKKTYIPYQKQAVAGLVFLGTVVPVMPLVREYAPLYLALGGEYGSILHNTYTVNLFIVGAAIGAMVVLAAPSASRFVTKARGEQVPYQGIGITLVLLVAASLIAQGLS